MNYYSDELMWLFLQFSSETPVALNCEEHIEYDVVLIPQDNPSMRRAGYKLKNKDVFVSDIIETLKDIDSPDLMRDLGLTLDEFTASINFIMGILKAFENEGRYIHRRDQE